VAGRQNLNCEQIRHFVAAPPRSRPSPHWAPSSSPPASRHGSIRALNPAGANP